MPNIKSAEKRVKVIATKTLQNQMIKSNLKTTLKSRLIDIALSQGFTAPVGTMGILGIKAWLYVNVRGKK